MKLSINQKVQSKAFLILFFCSANHAEFVFKSILFANGFNIHLVNIYLFSTYFKMENMRHHLCPHLCYSLRRLSEMSNCLLMCLN